jgi:hypothetical protein
LSWDRLDRRLVDILKSRSVVVTMFSISELARASSSGNVFISIP